MASTLPINLVHQESSSKRPVELVNAPEQESSKEAAGIQSLNLARPPAIKTMGEIENEQKKTLQYMLIDARKIIHLITSGICAVTSFAAKFLPESSGIRRSLEQTSSMLARLAIGIISGISGAFDAFKDGKHLLGWSQIGDAITTLIAPTEEITNYRGLWVGAYNMLPALETIEGKSQYAGFADNLTSTLSALKKTANNLMRNPAALFDPQSSGSLGVVTGALTSLCSGIYMLTGIRAFASARDALGMGVETEKLKSVHYKAGRSQYIASGWTMLLGSAANMVSKFTDGTTKKFWSYWNLAANAIGKLFYLDALQSNEPTRHQAPIGFGEMITNTLREAFNWGKETKASIERAQPHAIQDLEIAERVAELKEEEARAKKQVKLVSAGEGAGRYSSSSPIRRSRAVRRSGDKPSQQAKTQAPQNSKLPSAKLKTVNRQSKLPSSSRKATKL